MGTFSRLRYVIAANVNALLERAEDPEKLLRALIREMEEAREEARAAIAEIMAEEAGYQRRLQQLGDDISVWEERAELAVREERDDLARAALSTRADLERERDAVRAGHQEANGRVAQVESDLKVLNGKLDDAKALLANLERSAAQAPAGAPPSSRKLPAESKSDRKLRRAMNRFDSLESRVEGLEARVRSYDIGERSRDPWQELERPADEAIEAELDALKKRVSPAAAKPAAKADAGDADKAQA